MFKINRDAKWDARMAMSEQRFGEVKDAIVDFISEDLVNSHADGLSKLPRFQPGGAGDLAMRVRWDCYWNIRKHLPENREDLMDVQIDAALRRIVVDA